eukprot:TRINITY_DN853_c0_g1_i2.p1 TRINITY_DN853_c0_g1~~TRINITY_DN853_c0_g1_i2.p1  ORF type:complete len:102 (-),score=29.09 TRINITY_DN853_c0_g1_i2:57-362(-)
MNNWLSEIRYRESKQSVKFLIGNKSDLDSERLIKYEEVEELIEENRKSDEQLEYYECSAHAGSNIQLILEKMATKVLLKNNIILSPDSVPLNNMVEVNCCT